MECDTLQTAGPIADVSADEFDETVPHARAVKELMKGALAYAVTCLKLDSSDPVAPAAVWELTQNLLDRASEGFNDYRKKKHEQKRDAKKTKPTGDDKPDGSSGSKVGDTGPTGKATANDKRGKRPRKARWVRQAGANTLANASSGNKKNVQKEASCEEHNARDEPANALKHGTKRNTSTATKVTSRNTQYHGDRDVFPKEGDCATNWITYWADQLDPKELTVGAQAAWLRVISQAPDALTSQCKELWCRIITGYEGVGFRDAQGLIKRLNGKRLELGNRAYPLAGKGKDRDWLLAVILQEYKFWWERDKND